MDFGSVACSIRARGECKCADGQAGIHTVTPRPVRSVPCKLPWTGLSASSPAAAALVLGRLARHPRGRRVPFAGAADRDLTGGGFETTGSGSQVVVRRAGRDFPALQAETLAVVFDNREGDPQALAAAVDRVQREGFKDVEGVRAEPGGARRGARGRRRTRS